MPSKPARILILGGTRDARELAARLTDDARFAPVTSLAGVTRSPASIAGETRIGGFGGADGLAGFIRAESIALVADATHPFAERISANAITACAEAGVPLLRLERPAWEPRKGDNWRGVSGIGDAARSIPAGARAFVTVGRKEIARFFDRDDIFIVARMIERPDCDVPKNAELVLARPPFTPESERAFMEERGITVLVAKNAGGEATYAKIEAARELGLPVIMVSRPGKPPVPIAGSAGEMLVLIEQAIV